MPRIIDLNDFVAETADSHILGIQGEEVGLFPASFFKGEKGDVGSPGTDSSNSIAYNLYMALNYGGFL